ncbi:unnamed protein product [Lampetra planeri]
MPPPLRFAANVGWLFTEGEADISARCEAAKAAGFDAVEIPDPYGYWGRAGGPEETPRPPLPALPVALINSPRGDVAAGEMGLGALPGREADFLDSLQTAIAHAKALKCDRVHLLSGRLPPGATREAQGPAMEATLVRNLLTASDLLAVEGMTGLIEPINSRLTDPRYFLDTPRQAARILEKVDKPNIKLQLVRVRTSSTAKSWTEISRATSVHSSRSSVIFRWLRFLTDMSQAAKERSTTPTSSTSSRDSATRDTWAASTRHERARWLDWDGLKKCEQATEVSSIHNGWHPRPRENPKLLYHLCLNLHRP